MVHRWFLTCGSLLLVLPLCASAEQATTWDFRNSNVSGDWRVQELTNAQPSPEGLRIRTDSDGFIQRELDIDHPVDVFTLTFVSDREQMGSLLWHPADAPEGALAETLFAIPAGTNAVDVVPHIRQWDPETTFFGLGFRAGTDVILQSTTARHWSTGEKMLEAAKSFWTFDEFRPYSINFLWGPLLVFNPPARAELFDYLPPRAYSGVRVFYGFLFFIAAACVIAGLVGRRSPGMRRAAAMIFVVTVMGSWVLFDLRMGSELISYAVTDLQTHVLPPAGEKTLRTHGGFYDIMARAVPELQKEEKYLLIIPENTPYYQNLRYMSYPSLPIMPDGDVAGIDLLFVYDRPDITVNEQGQLVTQRGQVLSRGRILERFTKDSFLFRAE